MLICLDPGHGGRDSGAVNGSRYEKNDNLKLANMLRTALIKRGVKVIMTRTSDIYVSLIQRSDFANSNKADFFISLHRNAFTDNTAKGVENWVHNLSDLKTEGYAKDIMTALNKVGIQANRGVKRGNFHVTRETDMPACLLELGFISNNQDNALFDSKLESYADAIAQAICTSFNIPPVQVEEEDKSCEADGSCRIYRVQVGAYRRKETAEQIAKELSDKGYSTMVV